MFSTPNFIVKILLIKCNCTFCRMIANGISFRSWNKGIFLERKIHTHQQHESSITDIHKVIPERNKHYICAVVFVYCLADVYCAKGFEIYIDDGFVLLTCWSLIAYLCQLVTCSSGLWPEQMRYMKACRRIRTIDTCIKCVTVPSNPFTSNKSHVFCSAQCFFSQVLIYQLCFSIDQLVDWVYFPVPLD